MPDELVKSLLSAGIDTLLAVTILVLVYFLTKGRGKSTEDETATTLKREENEGMLIKAVSKSVETQSEMKTLLAKAVDLQADTVEWHKRHDAKIDDTNSALINLNKTVNERSKLDGQAFEELRDDMTTHNEQFDRRLATLEGLVAETNTAIQGLPKCEEFTKQLEEWKIEIITAVKDEAKRTTSTTAIVGGVQTNIISVDSDKKDEAA